MEIVSTYTHEHNQGGQPCNFFAGNAQKEKIQDDRHTFLVYITFDRLFKFNV